MENKRTKKLKPVNEIVDAAAAGNAKDESAASTGKQRIYGFESIADMKDALDYTRSEVERLNSEIQKLSTEKETLVQQFLQLRQGAAADIRKLERTILKLVIGGAEG